MTARLSDLSKAELAALAEVIDLWEQLIVALSNVEAHPRDCVLHIDSDIEPGYLGWIGYNEGGEITFQPAVNTSSVET